MSIISIFSRTEDFGNSSRTEKELPKKKDKIDDVPLQALTISSFEDKKDQVIYESVNVPTIPQNDNTDNRLRVMLCGTYPIGQSNGYSRVVYYISKYLGIKKDIRLTIYGFQNYNQTHGSNQRSDISKDVILHDALSTENPKRNGFGEKEIGSYLRQNPQDIIIIFNDSVITSALAANIIETFSDEERKKFLLVSYMDQVYPYQRRQYIELINRYFDIVIAFTPYWRDVARKIGIRKDMPMYFFPHGFDAELYYPVPKTVSRAYYSLPDDAFVILNLNRNQPRKRWDHTMMAFADVVHRHNTLLKSSPDKKHRPIRLMIGTMPEGFWDLLDVYDFEIRKLGMDVTEGRKYLVFMSKPQQMSDSDINVLYNACDIGLNTCEGEGFGLCQFEHLAVGCPQIAPNIGGMREFLNSNNSITVEAKWSYHVDKNRDGIGGVAEIGDVKDYADAIWKYYTNPTLVKRHGERGRAEILTHYRWESMVEYFYKIIKDIESKNERLRNFHHLGQQA